ncbi:porin [Ollibium composti]|uniref:Porin n=1 Tax=Ollibium composti TaxID=2675109 RepID=A0ABY2Q8F9_9HYPH|nr:porin [Mesorhizobium composti]THF56712.1 porin [Mesorhizobium composti]
MNIKSLLFGSAAALVAVSGARAADAVVVAEPEPAEYVKICDVYGAGYFYIPGTETCMRIGGYVRYTAGVGSEFAGYGNNGKWVQDRRTGKWQGTWSKETKIELTVDTGQETEYGTLSTHIAIDASNGTGRNGLYSLDPKTGFIELADGRYATTSNSAWLGSAYIKLGGLMIGYADSIFADWTGYAGAAINNSFIQYGDAANTNQISYTFDAGNGFSAIVGFEQGYGDIIDSYVPHVLAGAKFTQGWGGISAVAAYNSVYEEWAAKARLDVNVNEQFSLFVMGGYGTDDHSKTNDYKPWGGNWAVWGGGSFKANEKATIYAEASYDENKDVAASFGVAYNLVPGFLIKPEVNYTKVGGGEDGWGGVIRFQRNF